MKLVEALTVTYAAVGQEMSDVGLAIIARDLADYPLKDVFTALSRCRKELRKITLADILDRIPGGHPGVEEAWSIVARALGDEGATIVWTEEISQAFGSAQDLRDDPVAARMAFKEVYAKLVAESRDLGKPIAWTASLGHDPHGREGALIEAVQKGRLAAGHVQSLLPHYGEPPAALAKLLQVTQKHLSDDLPAIEHHAAPGAPAGREPQQSAPAAAARGSQPHDPL